MTRLAWILGTFFGAGLSPFAPGTVGSLAATIPLYFLPASGYAIVVAGLAVTATAIGPPLAERLIAATGRKDPQIFVLDEAAGIFIAAWRPHGPDLATLVLAFVSFRVFDITKPGWVKRAESLAGGKGVVYDDVVAGLLALIAGLVIEASLR